MTDVAQVSTRAGGVLAATCISTLVVNANTSAVSILLPAISEDTDTSVETLQWAVTGYSLVGAAVIVTSGSLGDVFGRKRVFQLGLLLFVASCVMIALAGSGGMVIAGRVIQVGGASGVSNMARYVGAAVATALAATIYGTVVGTHTEDGASQGNALASGLAAASWMMAAAPRRARWMTLPQRQLPTPTPSPPQRRPGERPPIRPDGSFSGRMQ
jgi:MFS family permease